MRKFSLWEMYYYETSVELLHVGLLTGFPEPSSVLKSGDTLTDWPIMNASLCLEIFHICCIACWDRLYIATRALITVLKQMS